MKLLFVISWIVVLVTGSALALNHNPAEDTATVEFTEPTALAADSVTEVAEFHGDRSPAITGPATDRPSGENSSMYSVDESTQR